MAENVIEGKAYCCYLNQPDIRSNPEWSLQLIPNEIDLQRFKKSGHDIKMVSLNNEDLGLSIYMRRRVKHMDDVLERPLMFDNNRKRLELFEELPNGSNVMIKYNEWEGISKTTNKLHKGLDLIAVILLDESPNLFKNRK
tara:strand:- start:30 stop:449 length:420 start_codon:yes stop_codon:yes gene_type:complete